jgi:hypothetical protein
MVTARGERFTNTGVEGERTSAVVVLARRSEFRRRDRERDPDMGSLGKSLENFIREYMRKGKGTEGATRANKRRWRRTKPETGRMGEDEKDNERQGRETRNQKTLEGLVAPASVHKSNESD